MYIIIITLISIILLRGEKSLIMNRGLVICHIYTGRQAEKTAGNRSEGETEGAARVTAERGASRCRRGVGGRFAPEPVVRFDHRDRVAGWPPHIARHGEAQRGRDRGGTVRGAERVVLALAALGEAGEAAAGTQRADAVAPSGQDLVRIGLVADVPDQPVSVWLSWTSGRLSSVGLQFAFARAEII